MAYKGCLIDLDYGESVWFCCNCRYGPIAWDTACIMCGHNRCFPLARVRGLGRNYVGMDDQYLAREAIKPQHTHVLSQSQGRGSLDATASESPRDSVRPHTSDFQTQSQPSQQALGERSTQILRMDKFEPEDEKEDFCQSRFTSQIGIPHPIVSADRANQNFGRQAEDNKCGISEQKSSSKDTTTSERIARSESELNPQFAAKQGKNQHEAMPVIKKSFLEGLREPDLMPQWSSNERPEGWRSVDSEPENDDNTSKHTALTGKQTHETLDWGAKTLENFTIQKPEIEKRELSADAVIRDDESHERVSRAERSHSDREPSVERCVGCDEAWKRPYPDLRDCTQAENGAEFISIAVNLIDRLRDPRTKAEYEDWQRRHSHCSLPLRPASQLGAANAESVEPSKLPGSSPRLPIASNTVEIAGDEDDRQSVQSVESSTTLISILSGVTAVEMEGATTELQKVFQGDLHLTKLYRMAIDDALIGPDKLQRNLERLLRIMARDLRIEARKDIEKLTARFVAMKARYVAYCVVEDCYNKPVVVQPQDESEDEVEVGEQPDGEDLEQVQPMDEDRFEDLILFRAFLVESNALQAFRDRLTLFVSPKGAQCEPPVTTTENFAPQLSSHTALDYIKLFYKFCIDAMGFLEPPLEPNKIRLRWQCVSCLHFIDQQAVHTRGKN